MSSDSKEIIQRLTFASSSKKWTKAVFLLLPFAIMSLLLVIIPLIMIIIKTMIPASGASVADNWTIINSFIWQKILMSLVIAIITTIVCILLAFPFTYFLSTCKNKIFKALVMFVVTAPVWTSFLVKLVGLKTFFDLCAGFNNSTYGNMWTVIGLVYLYLPFMIMPLYSVLNDMPRNLVYASYDLGYGGFKTFLKVVLPYTKTALISGITLVFLPALTTVAVPQFLNNNNSGSMIGDIIVEQGQFGLTSDIALARASTLSLVLCLILLGAYIAFVILKNVVWKRIKRRINRYE